MNDRAMAARLLFLLLLSAAALQAQGDEAGEPPLRWWKGNLHTHTLWSDGNDFPEMVADWYRRRGWNFLALSDHNVMAAGERWMALDKIVARQAPRALDAYLSRFGESWVETRKGGTDGQATEVRLKPLDEFRHLVEESGRFLLIPAEEVTDSFEKRPIHMNASNLREPIAPQGGGSAREVIERNLAAILEQEKRLGRPILAHLNHPNFQWGVSIDDFARVLDEKFFEVYNGHPQTNTAGDRDHPDTETIWDRVSAIRLREFGAPPIFGIATDDSHHYHQRSVTSYSRPGRGWVMVRSRRLTPESLIRAMRAGDFYASTGVTLSEISFDAEGRRLRVGVLAREGETYRIEFRGTREEGEPGEIFEVIEGPTATHEMAEDALYVRAVVTSSAAAEDPAVPGELQKAWTEPVGARNRR